MRAALIHGLTAGFLIAAFILVGIPHFIGRIRDLIMIPVFIGIAAMALAILLAPVRRRLRSRRETGAGRRRRWRGGFVLLGSFILTLILFAWRAPVRDWRVAPQVVVYGLDGATSNVLQPLIDAGFAPTFGALQRDGSHGELLSFEPSVSPILWTTIATGVLPEKHGIRSFYATRDQLRAPRIWELLEGDSLATGIFHWYITWPPVPTRGFLIPDILGRDSRCIPPEYHFVNEVRNLEKSGRGMSAGDVLGFSRAYLVHGVRMETCLAVARELVRARILERDPTLTHVALRRAELRLSSDVSTSPPPS